MKKIGKREEKLVVKGAFLARKSLCVAKRRKVLLRAAFTKSAHKPVKIAIKENVLKKLMKIVSVYKEI